MAGSEPQTRYADILITVGTAVAASVVVLVPREVPPLVRIAVVLPVLLFVPGYLVVTALYPQAHAGQTRSDATAGLAVRSEGSLSTASRVALSLVGSVALASAVALLATVTPWGVSAAPVSVGLTAVSLVAGAAAAARRCRAPPGTGPSFSAGWIVRAVRDVFRVEGLGHTVLTLVTVASVIIAAGTVGYALYDPPADDAFSEFTLLAENESGELVAADYPDELTRGEEVSLYVRIANHEGETVTYTVVVLLQQSGNGTTAEPESTELDRLRLRVASGDTRTTEHDVLPTETGTNLRLTYLFYKGDALTNPERESAATALHLQVNVTDGPEAVASAGTATTIPSDKQPNAANGLSGTEGRPRFGPRREKLPGTNEIRSRDTRTFITERVVNDGIY